MNWKRYSWRAVLQRPGRTILTTLSVVIGVGAVVSFSIVTSATQNAYREMFSLIAGKASLEVVGEGNASFPADLAAEISTVDDVRIAVPTIRRFSVFYFQSQRVRLQVLGIDPQRDSFVRDLELKEGNPIRSEDEMWIDQSLALRLKIPVGGQTKLLTNRGLKEFTVVGIVGIRGATTVSQAGLVYLNLSRAQYLFKAKDQVDAIQIVLDHVDDETISRARSAIAERLPNGISVRIPPTNSQQMKDALVASEQGLRLATIFSILSASCIMFNTFLMNVSERRKQIATMRVIGATSRQIVQLLVSESLIIGMLGTLLGVAVGIGFGFVLIRSIGGVANVVMPRIDISVAPFLLAGLFGLIISLAGASFPAWQAAKISPLEGIRRQSSSDTEGIPLRYVALGLVLTLVSTLLIIASLSGWISINVPTYASASLLLGVVILSSLLIAPASRISLIFLRPILGAESEIAARQILRHRIRSSLTAGVLFIAASTGTGLAYAIMDNIKNVDDWRAQAFEGDFFIRAMLPDMASGLSPDLPDELGDDLKKVNNLSSIEAASMVEVKLGERSVILIARDFSKKNRLPFDLVSGNRDEILRQLEQGDVVIGSVLALKFGLKTGDDIELDTLEGRSRFHICGVTNEYLVGGFSIYMHRDLAIRLLGVQGVDGYILRAAPDKVSVVQDDLQALCDRYGVLLHSFADVVHHIDSITRGIIASLWGVISLGFFVGAFGIVNALAMNVVEQTREFGLLRVIAMTRSQVRGTIFAQATIIGAVGLVPGILAGLVVAWVLSYAAMPSVGHPVKFAFHPWLMCSTFLSAVLLILVAALLPAERAARLNAVESLHYD